VETRSTRIPYSSGAWQPLGGWSTRPGGSDSHWPLARVGYFAFETDAFYSYSFC
jgi:hypothetical protein